MTERGWEGGRKEQKGRRKREEGRKEEEKEGKKGEQNTKVSITHWYVHQTKLSTVLTHEPSGPSNTSPISKLRSLSFDHTLASFSLLRCVHICVHVYVCICEGEGNKRWRNSHTHTHTRRRRKFLHSPVPIVYVSSVGSLFHYPARISLAPLRHIVIYDFQKMPTQRRKLV